MCIKCKKVAPTKDKWYPEGNRRSLPNSIEDDGDWGIWNVLEDHCLWEITAERYVPEVLRHKCCNCGYEWDVVIPQQWQVEQRRFIYIDVNFIDYSDINRYVDEIKKKMQK